jgi:hypothetical protein
MTLTATQTNTLRWIGCAWDIFAYTISGSYASGGITITLPANMIPVTAAAMLSQAPTSPINELIMTSIGGTPTIVNNAAYYTVVMKAYGDTGASFAEATSGALAAQIIVLCMKDLG